MIYFKNIWFKLLPLIMFYHYQGFHAKILNNYFLIFFGKIFKLMLLFNLSLLINSIKLFYICY